MNGTVDHFGQIDILVNGAAGNFLCCAEDLTPSGFKTGIYFEYTYIYKYKLTVF